MIIIVLNYSQYHLLVMASQKPKDNGEESPSPKGVVDVIEQIDNRDEEQKKWAEMNTFSWKLPEQDVGHSALLDIMNNGKGGFVGNTELFHTEQSDFTSVCDAFFEKDELLLLLENDNEIDIAQIADSLQQWNFEFYLLVFIEMHKSYTLL